MTAKPEKIMESEALTLPQSTPDMPVEFAQYLQSQDFDLSAVSIPRVPFYWKVTWEDLCVIRTKDAKVLVSPLCVVVNMYELPEAEAEFPDYRGMMRLEFVTEERQEQFITTSMCYAATGEYLPLVEWARNQRTPYLVRFGYIETRKVGRHVVRAMPKDIPLL